MSTYRKADIELIERLACHEARESFYAFRRFMRPNMKVNWFVADLCGHLQQFYDDLIDGQRPILAITAPPQHGKTIAVVDFLAWLAGKNPDLKSIYTSFSKRLGTRANLALQRIFDSPKYAKVFPELKIKRIGDKDPFAPVRNSELIEFSKRDGFFRNTTVRGSITGESLDVGVIDDPIKGREAANSETIREGTWDWLTDDFFTRFSESAGLLFIMTRWHVDDPLSRMEQEVGDQMKVVKYQAIAETNEKYRAEGEPLFPEHKSLDFLLTRKKTMASISWSSLYQQTPKIVGGSIIKPEDFRFYKILPRIVERCIYGDTAQKTKEHNDYSVFECWGRGEDKNLYLLDLIRGKWEAPELKRNAIAFWNKHKALNSYELGTLRKLKIEDKASGTGLIQEIRRNSGDSLIPVEGIERGIDKYTRVLDIVGYIESGYVYLPEDAPFLSDFLIECEAFTADDSHMYDDQIDPMCDAVSDMLVKSDMSIWERLA